MPLNSLQVISETVFPQVRWQTSFRALKEGG